ncbi:hypothetical protein WMY93_031829 [Mugilogobius chulae]|uniref:Uncharacterized protein n=1 Tax=Mugilogobius chulae TaxID=88201 RepID=A0AAW0MHG8_9GOBI
MYKKPKPNQDAVSQVLDLEFQARRSYIDSDVPREECRAAQILEAYPCFKELHHVLGELRRILAPSNEKFLNEVRHRWEEFCSRVHFYGVSKKAMKPPMTMDKTEAHIAMIKALPVLFPSPAPPPPKKTGGASEASLHILKRPPGQAQVILSKNGTHPDHKQIVITDKATNRSSWGSGAESSPVVSAPAKTHPQETNTCECPDLDQLLGALHMNRVSPEVIFSLHHRLNLCVIFHEHDAQNQQ